MVLFPRKTKFKKYFKFRAMFRKYENRCIVPGTGASCLKIIKGGRITAYQLEAARKVCKRKLKVKFKKENPFFNVFTDIGVSKKSSGLRMGKGKGSIEFWAAFSSSGRSLIELSSFVNKFAATSALQAASLKLPFKTKIIFTL
jgi:large subunit ribosomal protein L16